MKTDECDHDWRANPHELLMTNPPKQVIICVNCNARRTRVDPRYRPVSYDPRDWPKVVLDDE